MPFRLTPDGKRRKGKYGAYEHLPPTEWPDTLGEDYRRCCTSVAWIGQALTLRLLRMEKVWNHDAFFDYCDRWMVEDDTEHVKIIKDSIDNDYSAKWARQGQCWDKFVEDMWARYRTTLEAPIDGWKVKKGPAPDFEEEPGPTQAADQSGAEKQSPGKERQDAEE